MVYIFLADGFEEIEGLTVVDLLRRVNVKINMVSVTGSSIVTGAHGIGIEADILFEEADFSDAEMLVLPGGMPGTVNLMRHEGLGKLITKAADDGKILAAICAAPRVLGSLGLLRGKKATCYPGTEDASFRADYRYENVVEDGNIITSRGLGTAIDFALALVTRLKGGDEAARLAKSVIYNHY
jgi:4-methyl-5(b-hydroxyethyl)-thiazole monophosphate biosynthesis